MIDKICEWIESITVKKFLTCLLVLIISAVSLGFCIGKNTENSLMEVIQNEKN